MRPENDSPYTHAAPTPTAAPQYRPPDPPVTTAPQYRPYQAPAPTRYSAPAPTRSYSAPSRSSSSGSSGGGGGGSFSGGGSAAPAAPSMDAQSAAAQYGYSLAFFDSDPELKGLLDQAVSGNWNANLFVAKLRNTSWFQQHGEAMRKYTALKTSDPATFQAQLGAQASKIASMASSEGAVIDGAGASWLADQAMQLGWSDDQIKDTFIMGGFIKKVNGAYQGAAGQAYSQLKTLVGDYGVDVSDDTVGSWVQQAAVGRLQPDSIKAQLMQQAASKYPPLAARINAGETMRQIADPYVQSQAKLLELNPAEISFKDDPLIQQALVTKDAQGNPSSKTVWQFEQDVRNDPRWGKTQNAQDASFNAANKILGSFGMTA